MSERVVSGKAAADEVSMEALSLPARHGLVPLICVQQVAVAAQRGV